MKKIITMILVFLALPMFAFAAGPTTVVDSDEVIAPLRVMGGRMAVLDNSNDACLSDVPSIYYNGLWWAWGSPCDGGCSTTDPAFFKGGASSDGWRYATENEWSVRPDVSLFGTSGDFLCAASFFDSVYSHCDYTDAASGFLSRTPSGANYESWFVHNSCVNGGGGDEDPQVPEFGVLAAGMAIVGAIAIFLVRKKN